MTWKTVLMVLGSVLLIVCGKALELELKSWAELTEFKFVMTIGLQFAGVIGVFVGGLYTDKPGGGQ